ncbi:unnamed protein product [Cuscuta europaea]|uniref:Uncharacterized protein n=1 Tax=Cuscuta europaea TaxID=41803 RepID=A0A9P0ZG49_CUSEU|nr:unnamed protein product [Cuscuta europaea]
MTISETTAVISITAATHFPIKLTPSNFPVWKSQVHNALVGLGLDSYVDGSLSPPDKFSDAAKTQLNPCYTIWFRQDKTIISGLLGSCSETIQPIISSATTARHAWEKLSLTYASTSRGRIISLKTTLARTTRGTRSILDYLADMYALSEALALAQNPISDEDLVINILNGLGPDYSEITSAIRVRTADLSLTELQDILLETEKQHQQHAAATSELLPTANVTQASAHYFPADRRPSHNNDRRGHPSRRGRGGSNGVPRTASNSIVCRFCDFTGHDVKSCRKLQRFLRNNQVPYAPAPTVNHTTTTSSTAAQPWLFDSGASHHVTSDASILPSYSDYGGPDEVHLGNGPSHRGTTNARAEHS